MTATIKLNDQELAELKEMTRKSDVSAALRTAMVQYIRYAKRMRLKKLAGKVRMQDNWRELEALEMDAQNGSAGSH